MAYLTKEQTTSDEIQSAIKAVFEEMSIGRIQVVASRSIEIEVRLETLEKTRAFHDQLKACKSFESYEVSSSVNILALKLADRIQGHDEDRRGNFADLIHVATAISARADEYWTTDKKQIKWYSDNIISEVKICVPWDDQRKLSFE